MATSRLHLHDEGRGRPFQQRPERPALPRIEKYEVETEIGRGDLVRVFRAFDRSLGRPVTLKLLTDLGGSALTRRFRAEVASIAKLRSPHLIAIYGLGEHVGLPFAAMQVLGEDDLGQAIRNQRELTLLQKMLILGQVAEGVRAANQGGLSYVGLRPSGIALGDDGKAIIQDFGVVRLNPDPENEAAFYAAPEEHGNTSPPDWLCDIFAFGTVCYEWIAGVHPFRSGGGQDAEMAYEPPRPLRDLAPDCSEEVEQLVSRALHLRREFRYQNLDELLDDAEPILRQLKHEQSKRLLADARRLIDERELEQAHLLLREVLQLDPDNTRAHRYRSEIRSMLGTPAVRPRIEMLLRQADEESAAGNFGRTVELLESALRLDENDAGIARRLEQARSRQVQSARCTELTAEARQRLEEGALEEAKARILEALESDPENAGAADVLRAIEEAVERQERESRIEAGLVKAKSFLLLEDFDRANAILSKLKAEHPDSPVVDHWLEHVQKQEAEARRQSRLEEGIEQARALMNQQRYNGVIVLLAELSTEFPGEPLVAELMDQAFLARERGEALTETEARARELCGQGRFEAALETLDSSLALYPGEPTLGAVRSEIEEQWQAIKSGAEAQRALSQVDWLLAQGRPDLAAQFLRDKTEEHPEREDLVARLVEIRKILHEWEMTRSIEGTLKRVASLEQLEQWPVALTVVEEALLTYPSAQELLDAAYRLRNQIAERERRKKLTRRLEIIRQKISIESWSQAVLLIEAARTEFPGEAELDQLRQSVEDGRRRSEAENIIREVRQLMADGELERAQEVLRKAGDALPGEAAIQALQNELKAGQEYREEFRTAQVLFGRRQFLKAEQILVRLAAPHRPEIALLLEKVREARTASEEDDFYNSGREKALKLFRQQQYEQAADLLRNLLKLFPGDPILEHDLQSIEAASQQAPAAAAPAHPDQADDDTGVPPAALPAELVGPAPAPAEIRCDPPAPSLYLPKTGFQPLTRSRVGLVCAAGLLLVLVSTALWLSRRGTHSGPPAKAAASPPRVQAPVTAPAPTEAAPPDPNPAANPPAPQIATARVPASSAGSGQKSNTAAVRPFTMPSSGSVSPQSQDVALPAPPGTASPSAVQVSNLPSSLNHAPAAIPPPAPPAAATPAPTAPAASAAPEPANTSAPANPSGGRFQPPEVISAPKPTMPPLARQQRASGTVELVATVDTAGRVKGVKVLKGSPLLSGAAVNSVLKWRYRPATLNGQAIETTINLKVVFSLEQE